MLHDLRGTYIRRDGGNFRRSALLKFLAIWLTALLASAALLFVSLKSGTTLGVADLISAMMSISLDFCF
jgi:hypothetical protein